MEPAEIEEMFRMVAIGDYDDRYVIPKRHGEVSPDAFAEQGSCGIDFPAGRRPRCPEAEPGRRLEDGPVAGRLRPPRPAAARRQEGNGRWLSRSIR